MIRMSRTEIWRLVSVLLLGQMASILVAVAGFCSSYIADLDNIQTCSTNFILLISLVYLFLMRHSHFKGVDTPLTQCLLVYLSLILVYGSVLLYRRQKLLVPWYWYIMLGIFDVQGNYLGVKAFQYTSITSVTLVSCGCIPCIMILTWIILRTHYSLWQIFSAAICMVGVVLVLLFRVSGGGGKNPLLGNTLVIAGVLCYALSIVGEEFCVKKKDQIEVVAMLGVFGALISACEISIFERKDLASVQWSPTMIALFAGYTAATFLYYAVVPYFLEMSGAALFYLSLLTSNIWAVLIRIFFYHQQVDWLYYLALAIVTAGLTIYSFNAAATDRDDEAAIRYETLQDESTIRRAEDLTV